jgi:hypothetical protein
MRRKKNERAFEKNGKNKVKRGLVKKLESRRTKNIKNNKKG